jgi:hypothetical protein
MSYPDSLHLGEEGEHSAVWHGTTKKLTRRGLMITGG